MPSHRPLVLALVVLLLAAALAGCAQSGANIAEAVVSQRTIAVGSTAAFPVVLANGTSASVSVADAAGLDVEVPGEIDLPENGTAAVYVNVTVPADAGTGSRTVVVEVTSEGTTDRVELTVEAVAGDDRIEAGQTAQVEFTGRTVNGTILFTNEQEISNSTLPKADRFRPPQRFQPLNVTVGSEARNLIPGGGLVHAIEGIAVGTSVVVALPPGDAFGNTTLRQTLDRQQTVDRNRTMQRVFAGQRQRFQGLINETHEEGDVVNITLGADDFPYEITHLNSSAAELTLDVQVGANYTHIPGWPDSSEVVRVNDTIAEFYITPTVEANATFTFHERWPDASQIVSMNETAIVVEHSPEVGTEWEGRVGRQTVTRTVVELTDDEVVYEQPNNSRLAGMTIIFDLTVVGRV